MPTHNGKYMLLQYTHAWLSDSHLLRCRDSRCVNLHINRKQRVTFSLPGVNVSEVLPHHSSPLPSSHLPVLHLEHRQRSFPPLSPVGIWLFIAAGGTLFGLPSVDCLQINKALKATSPSPTPAAGNDAVRASVCFDCFDWGRASQPGGGGGG